MTLSKLIEVNTMSYLYDSAGRVRGRIDVRGDTTYLHDRNDRVVAYYDAVSNITRSQDGNTQVRENQLTSFLPL